MANKGILEKLVSLFENAMTTTTTSHFTINDLLKGIQGGIFSVQVNKARALLKENPKKYYEYKKKHVSGFTLSTFCKHRLADNESNYKKYGKEYVQDKLIYHTGLLQIDIDKIPEERFAEIKDIIKNDKYTLFCFDSLSGKGIKAAIVIDGKFHKESFLQAEKYYKEKYNLEIDKAVKDIFRLCFISNDPELYINEKAKKFTLQVEKSTNIKKNLVVKTKTPNSLNNNRMEKYAAQGIENAKNILNSSTNGNRHNARCRAGYLLGGYVGGGFFSKEYAMGEIETSVLRNTSLPKEKAMKTIEDGIKSGMSEPIYFEQLEKGRKDYLQQKYGDNWFKNQETKVQTVNKVTGEITETYIKNCFWYETAGKKNEIHLKIAYTKLYNFLKEIGIKKLILDSIGLKRILVKIENNIVSEIDIPEIQKILYRFIDSLPFNISENKTKKDLHELIGKGINIYINEDKINYYLPFERIEFLNDTQDKSFFFFKNGFVEVSKDNIALKSYNELKGYIWKSQIIEANFKTISDSDTSKLNDFDFVKFIKNICSIKGPEKILDEERYKALICTIGYLLHNYRTVANKFAVILTEANVGDEPQGRTGKGLLMQAIGKLRNVVHEKATNLKNNNSFMYQKINLDTQIFFIDEVDKYFKFDNLFSEITEGITIEKKFRDSIFLTADKAPKIVLATNYAIQGNTESHKGRKHEMELLCYYNSRFRPVDDFGNEFFHTWNSEKWNLFYNFMLRCAMEFFKNDKVIPTYSSTTIDAKKLLNATSKEFVEYADLADRNKNIPCRDFYKGYLLYAGLNENDKDKPTNHTIGKWLRIYCDYKNIILPESNQVKIEGQNVKCYKLINQ